MSIKKRLQKALLKILRSVGGSLFQIGGEFHVSCYGPDGQLKWADTAPNLIPNAALQHILDRLFISGTAAVDPWYVGLILGPGSGTTFAATDTLALHGGWTETTGYSGNRKEYVNDRTNQTVSNSTSKASFAIISNGLVVAGALLASVASGTSGTLLAAGDFTGGDKDADSGDTIEVTYTVTATSS